jgi:hypothetical protein
VVSDSVAVLRLFLPEAPPAALSRLRALIPGMVATPLGFEIPLLDAAPEEILSLLLQFGITARATRIITTRTRAG